MNAKSKCPLCSKSYQSLNDLDKHCKKIHNTDIQTLRELQKSKPVVTIRFEADDLPDKCECCGKDY